MTKLTHRLTRTLFFASLIIGLCFLATAVLADDEPSIDFKDVANWETINQSGPNNGGNVFIVKRNPDPNHVVKYILVRRWEGLNWAITGYAYYEGEKLFVYQLTSPYSLGRFAIRTEPLSEEEKAHIWGLLHPGVKRQEI